MIKHVGSVFLVFMMGCCCNATVFAANAGAQLSGQTLDAQNYLTRLVGDTGIGPREAGTPQEKATADYIQNVLSDLGYQVERQPFDVTTRQGKALGKSQNIIAHKAGLSGKYIVLGAHYDSTNADGGSHGAIDNGAGVAVLLSLAKYLSGIDTLKDGVMMVAFGAEEIGLQGAKYFVNSLTQSESDSYIGMINMDTIVGGDKLYIHSAHSKPYSCKGLPNNYRFDIQLRARLMALSEKIFGVDGFALHPDYAGYPAGETGSWSDHAPFACAGMPVAYIEATNFSINGKDGNDGYSQSIHPELWDCIDKGKVTACNRETEKQWGHIWHTKADKLGVMEQLFPQRINRQMDKTLQLLTAFFSG